MKLFVKLLITALVLAVLLPFTILKDDSGRPLMSLRDLKMPDMAVPGQPDGATVKGEGIKDVIYQWRDEEGNLNFTSEPPAPGIEYSVKGYDPNLNLIQSIKTQTETAEVGSKTKTTSIESPLKIGNPYSPEKINKLFDDAEKVQDLINQRMQQQEAVLNQDY